MFLKRKFDGKLFSIIINKWKRYVLLYRQHRSDYILKEMLVAFNERAVLSNSKVIIIYYEVFRKDKLISTNIIES